MKGLLYFVAYIALFFGAFLSLIWRDRRKRRMRKPFPVNLRLLRMPNTFGDESSKITKAICSGLLAMLAPMLLAGGALYASPSST